MGKMAFWVIFNLLFNGLRYSPGFYDPDLVVKLFAEGL